MGAIAEPSSSRARGRRSLDAVVNLVPYVDILMTLMVFLVLCAVFTQMRALTTESAASAGALASSTEATERVEPIRVLVTSRGVRVTRGALVREIARGDRAALQRALREVGAAPVELRSEDGVSYGVVVEVVDAAYGAGLRQVSLEGATG